MSFYLGFAINKKKNFLVVSYLRKEVIHLLFYFEMNVVKKEDIFWYENESDV